MLRALCLLAALLLVTVATARPAQAQSIVCNGNMSNIVFGTVSLRSGVANELRPGSNGPSGGTWDAVFVSVPTTLGAGSISVPVFADITSTGVSVGTGSYASTFSGASNVWIEYNTSSCSNPGTTRVLDPFTVSADVAASCEVDAGTLDFGTLGPTTTGPVDASTVFFLRCTDGTPYDVRLDNGVGWHVRRFVRWHVWRVFGRIFGGQALIAGSYTDSVLITVEY